MKTILLVFAIALISLASAQGPPPPSDQPPEINWGKCESLKPTDKEKEEKKKVIDECLKESPPPSGEVNEEDAVRHHAEITVCALKKEKWLTEEGPYDFERAYKELEPKVPKEIKEDIAKQHEECKEEATKKIPDEFAGQAQLYQACMDFHVSEKCGIEIVRPPQP
uniref:Secreted protein n=1 Tax=Hadrurus spadix TaxID=141984 RepID=A0A1W7R9L2_9SCOR